MRVWTFRRWLAASLRCKLLITNWAFLSMVKPNPFYSGRHSEAVSSHMVISLQKSKLLELCECVVGSGWSKAMTFSSLRAWFWKDSRTVFYHLYICLTEVTGKKKIRSKDSMFTTHMLLPWCIFLLFFPGGLNFLSCATARARVAKESDQHWECSKVFS